MGAGQSSDGRPSSVDVQVKMSYYELLGVQRQATDDEIKRAYRRKALELHPDRNFGNEEEATKTFAEVQAAYEVLSDAQERAWYDSHEAAILRGDDDEATEGAHSYENVKVTTADDLARVVRKFNSNVEFSDSPSGFFGFLREQFEHLAKEEEAAGAWDNVDVCEYPPFGHQADNHGDVVKDFYSVWTDFSTVKSFAWKDRYRLSEAPDRRVRRLMEKENNNLRQEAIREFNEAVRSFVLFVRKRDPRSQPNTQSEVERQQSLREMAEAQRARARAANLANIQSNSEPDWSQIRDDDELQESSEEEVEEEVIECVACNKVFKSERQYEAHERSKKHQKAVQALQRKIQKENKHLNLDDDDIIASQNSVDDWDVIGDEDVDEMIVPTTIDETHDDADHTATKAVMAHTKENELAEGLSRQESAAGDDDPQEEDDDDDVIADEDLQHDPADGIKTLHVADDSDSENEKVPVKKKGKAAQKRAKRAAAAESAPVDNNHECATCNKAFPSRTQLFQHIKKHGHAALKPAGKSKKGKK